MSEMVERVRAVIADAMHVAMMGQSTEMHKEAVDQFTSDIFKVMREPPEDEMIERLMRAMSPHFQVFEENELRNAARAAIEAMRDR